MKCAADEFSVRRALVDNGLLVGGGDDRTAPAPQEIDILEAHVIGRNHQAAQRHKNSWTAFFFAADDRALLDPQRGSGEGRVAVQFEDGSGWIGTRIARGGASRF